MTEHLHPRVAALLDLPIAERVNNHWTKIWIDYPKAGDLLEEMVGLRDAPPQHRPRNILLFGTTGNGKSGLLWEFAKQNLPFEAPGHDYLQFPVLRIETPSKPDEGRFWTEILNQLQIMHRVTANSARKEELALKAMKGAGVKLLILDEIHNVLTGSYNQQRLFMTIIKRTSNMLGIPIVAAGTEDAKNVLQYDGQLASRFRMEELPDWQLNNEFLDLLGTFEVLIPLRNRSSLTNSDLATDLHVMSRGILGELSEILRQATIAAIKDKSEQITRATLKKIKWKPPGSKK
ncbi:MAG TPA: TniB family NTP-binding protein [Magnetospirillaceae bacterium]